MDTLVEILNIQRFEWKEKMVNGVIVPSLMESPVWEQAPNAPAKAVGLRHTVLFTYFFMLMAILTLTELSY